MMFAKLLALVEKPGVITLAEIQEKLAQRDTPVGTCTVWRFFARHRITHKKRLRTLASWNALTS